MIMMERFVKLIFKRIIAKIASCRDCFACVVRWANVSSVLMHVFNLTKILICLNPTVEQIFEALQNTIFPRSNRRRDLSPFQVARSRRVPG